jgi:hypothetical protein
MRISHELTLSVHGQRGSAPFCAAAVRRTRSR